MRYQWWPLSTAGHSRQSGREVEGRNTGREWIPEGSTFSSGLPQLSVLNEPGEHLRLHEDAEEAADAFWRHRFAESLPLKNALAALILGDEEGVVTHGLQEEADERLRHQAVQGVILCGHKGSWSVRNNSCFHPSKFWLKILQNFETRLGNLDKGFFFSRWIWRR